MRYLVYTFVFAGVLSACSSNPYKHTNRFYRKQAKQMIKPFTELPSIENYGGIKPEYPVGTTNFNLRKPNFVIIHHTAQNSCEQTLKTFTLQRTQVSAHYVICKDGTVHHMLNDYLRAWHAGIAKWGNLTDVNSSSLGIELDNNGNEPFPDAQIKSLLELLGWLKKNYSIPTANFIGHADIAPRRKPDPSAFFPWKVLADKGFGYWPDMIVETVPAGFNSLHALRMIGYDTKDSVAAIKAFKLHFVQTDLSPRLSEADKGILNNLIKKY
ncbi:N-acetylmuramoyl-L-alanine amidase [Pararcticibacter amylolyticus]|uniref:N-acetylmuramoyl-L-alanine amidase n=1 Tax=Pararcticibacter amylolyticus TaxID=2173175 RepID=A0A2U2PMJ3_9SPHI|nr:N-acetylmuramoyl-L-alanine amidase [Pararcticibacter amylolyticus]PWG82623.1 N-acetylmuramoyl-L-alanine amidase [Pararcticibacter amylolyticus]